MNTECSQISDTAMGELKYEERSELFKTLYNQYFDRVFHCAFFYAKSKEVAEDLTQEVFEKVWGKLDNVRLDNFKAYLLVMVRNHYLNCKKKDNKLRISILDYCNSCSHFETYDMMLEKECWALYEKALDELTLRQRQLFALKIEGHKNNDIAIMMNISTSTVNNTVYSAMFKVREYVMQNLNVLSPA